MIFKVLAKFPPEGATHSQLISEIKNIRSDYPPSNLTKNLISLQSEEKGAILMEDTSSGKYLFSEPLYRPFSIALLKDKAGDDDFIKNSLQTVIGKLAYNLIVKELEKKYKIM